jgi:hypothetical protein
MVNPMTGLPDVGMLPPPLVCLLGKDQTLDSRLISMMSCISDLNALAASLRFEIEARGDAAWDEREKLGLLIDPVAYHLLHQSRTPQPSTEDDIISEALRLGALTWISLVKQKCRSYPRKDDGRVSMFLESLTKNPDEYSVWDAPSLRPIRLWLLLLGSMSGPSGNDLSNLIEMMAREMEEYGSLSWDDVMSNARQMPWIDLFEAPCARLEVKLLTKVSERELNQPCPTVVG